MKGYKGRIEEVEISALPVLPDEEIRKRLTKICIEILALAFGVSPMLVMEFKTGKDASEWMEKGKDLLKELED